MAAAAIVVSDGRTRYAIDRRRKNGV